MASNAAVLFIGFMVSERRLRLKKQLIGPDPRKAEPSVRNYRSSCCASRSGVKCASLSQSGRLPPKVQSYSGKFFFPNRISASISASKSWRGPHQ